jgi:hypothetical protein
MNEVLSAKRVSWGYYKKLKNNDNEIELTGIQHCGSIITDRAVEYDKYLHLKFKVFIQPNPTEGAAILDLDFWDKKRSFVSIVLGAGKTNLSVKDGNKIHGIVSIPNLSGWQDIEVYLDHKKVHVLLDNQFFLYKFKRKKKNCTISFGNNVMPSLFGADLPTSWILKDVVAETENGLFPLIIKNLINVESMRVWGAGPLLGEPGHPPIDIISRNAMLISKCIDDTDSITSHFDRNTCEDEYRQNGSRIGVRYFIQEDDERYQHIHKAMMRAAETFLLSTHRNISDYKILANFYKIFKWDTPSTPMAQHPDLWMDGPDTVTPDISLVMYFTDNFGGGELVFSESGTEIKPKAGDIAVFDSTTMHGVNPVLSGTRITTQLFLLKK